MAIDNDPQRLERIRDIVGHLCSKECAGRKTGSRQAEVARARIVSEMEQAGLRPAGESGFIQSIPSIRGANVIGALPGKGRGAERSILVCAHYDHLGEVDHEHAYWGADDNAAAVAILIDSARQIAKSAQPPGRQIVFVAFDAEEPPHFLDSTMGSQHYVNNPLVSLPTIDMMICMDLMGHALGKPGFPASVRKSFFVLGAEKSKGTGAIVDRVSDKFDRVRAMRMSSDVVPPMSDYYAFERASVPYLFLTCGRWEHYHQITDTPDRLDYDKILGASDFLAGLVTELSHRAHDSVYLPTGRDDAACVATLRRLAEELMDVTPSARAALTVLGSLSAKLAQGRPLASAERDTIKVLVAGLEAAIQ